MLNLFAKHFGWVLSFALRCILANSLCSPNSRCGCSSPFLSVASWQTPTARQCSRSGCNLLLKDILAIFRCPPYSWSWCSLLFSQGQVFLPITRRWLDLLFVCLVACRPGIFTVDAVGIHNAISHPAVWVGFSFSVSLLEV